LGCSGISWAIGKQSAPRSRQITTPTPHHSIFYRPGALSDALSDALKVHSIKNSKQQYRHWKQICPKTINDNTVESPFKIPQKNCK